MNPGDRVTLRTGDTVAEGIVKSVYTECGDVTFGSDAPTVEIVLNARPADRPRARRVHPQIGDQFTIQSGGLVAEHRPSTKEEEHMDEYPKATLIRKPESKTVNVYLEIEEGIYLARKAESEIGHERVEREIGQEMPIFMTLPEEYFLPIVRAACDETFRDPRTGGLR